jgi:PAS domain S-box-containing protein
MSVDSFSKEDMSCLVSAVQQLSAARDVSVVSDLVRQFARKLAAAEGACVVLRQGDEVFYAAEDSIEPLWLGRRLPVHTCVEGWAIEHNVPVAIEDIYADARVPHELYRPTYVKSLAVMPVNRSAPMAAIGVYWANPHRATERELALLQALADATATAVANSELYRGLSAARSELEQAGARLRLALEAGAIGTWDLDPLGGTLIWDQKCKELFGLSGDAAVDYTTFLNLLHPDDRAAVATAVDAALAGERDGVFEVEYRRVPNAGESGEFWIAARGQAQFDQNGKVVRFVGTARDASAEKRAEAEKLELLRRANAANMAKDEFLAMLGHELRNPLAPIVTAIELLKMRGHQATREVATIERQSQHLVRLVDDLLDIARVTQGKLELKRHRVGLDAIVTKAIEIAAPLIERRRHTLDVEITSNVFVEGDEFRLAQVLANLLTNAAKYMADGGRIQVFAGQQDDHVLITVRDSGRGISPELLPRLFAPFVQAAQSKDRSQGGLGLGLALARSIAEMHGGSVHAHSEGPGKGSLFSVRLPPVSNAADRKSVEVRAIRVEKVARPLSILVVDDNGDAAELLAVLLRGYGHRVRVALDPVEALEEVRRAVPEVAFMDIGLPVMDGYELAEHLRTELKERCPALIAVTGYGQEQDRRRSASAGFALHLVKPVQRETVVDALTQVSPSVPLTH